MKIEFISKANKVTIAIITYPKKWWRRKQRQERYFIKTDAGRGWCKSGTGSAVSSELSKLLTDAITAKTAGELYEGKDKLSLKDKED